MPTSTLHDFQTDIQNVTGILVAEQLIRFGFPPKTLQTEGNGEETLEKVGVKDGETFILERVEGGFAPQAGVGVTREAVSPAAVPAGGMAREPPARANGPVAVGKGHGIPLNDGILLVREMKDDNSCLFRSIGYVLERFPENTSKYRQIIADTIQRDATYSEAILGREPSKYRSWILEPNSWGGAIELAILSDHFQIDSIDVGSLRIDRFGEGKYPRRVFVMYSGIHYDALALTPDKSAPAEFDQTTFEGDEGDRVYEAALEVAKIWKKEKKFTDLANFTLRCGICKKGIVGQHEAQAHAMETGHAQFTEYS
ncbi:uncharacterized protein EV422DRAFT_111109 [Fimicolochytrium jonesii]|uniref:uncharacterized protein n=1 Tax=Fimicolochytrium jonesii TaxID=1396493 RepID=UPI0022FDCEB5|nr:uncharacterized protein EV422DRAFT_111109 [Fimicolochytrium jonesii]KAI8819396.1 hypothetical protein EV422DRAFT_111109 [Fimicolochytrium jonesii]